LGVHTIFIHFSHLPSAPKGRQQGGQDGIEGAHPDAVYRVDGPFPGRARGLLVAQMAFTAMGDIGTSVRYKLQ